METDLSVGEVRDHVWILSEQGIQVEEQKVRLWLELLNNVMDLDHGN
jgi:hypothetical protein